MRIHLIAVGRLKSGPEFDLTAEYLGRAEKIGRALSLGPVVLREVEDRRNGGKAAEADLLRRAIPNDAAVCILDERGKVESSPDFAKRLEQWRDSGFRALAFVIGGADGTDGQFRAEASHLLSFGKMVWPHMLARVMLSEQIYRSISILAGSPYHRV